MKRKLLFAIIAAELTATYWLGTRTYSGPCVDGGWRIGKNSGVYNCPAFISSVSKTELWLFFLGFGILLITVVVALIDFFKKPSK